MLVSLFRNNFHNVSIDWLCGRQEEVSLSDLSDVASFLYKLMEINEIGCEIAVHDRMENGLDNEKKGETDDRNRWWTRLTFYGNDQRFKYNGDLCQIISKMNENVSDLESYAISKDSYEREKETEIDSCKLPLTQKNMIHYLEMSV